MFKRKIYQKLVEWKNNSQGKTAPKTIVNLFDDMNDLNYFFLQLQLYYGVDFHKRDSVIIFDEVQFCPKARQAIKLLVKDGSYDYIETGSLISIKKKEPSK